jgi:DNA-binding PadR family transcriptional regulator
VNLTQPTALALQAVARGYRYGFDIMTATGLPSGTVYPLLRRLEREGCVVGRWESEDAAFSAGRPRRRTYRITPRGRELLASALQRFAYLRDALANP